MSDSLLICTDLDRTLIPNGPQPESKGARAHFRKLAAHTCVTLAYVSGRHRELVEKAIRHYRLPQPDFVIGDVGTTIYRISAGNQWHHERDWERQIEADWGGHRHSDLKQQLTGLAPLRLQEYTKQNAFKLSYYVPLNCDRAALSRRIHERLAAMGARCNLIWSNDESQGIGLLDVLPASASKYHAIESLMQHHHFNHQNTVFCGDSGNDLEVLISPVPSVLVANAEPLVKQQAVDMATRADNADRLYLAHGDFHDMNGNYSAGVLEGIAHFHPRSIAWMGFDEERQQA